MLSLPYLAVPLARMMGLMVGVIRSADQALPSYDMRDMATPLLFAWLEFGMKYWLLVAMMTGSEPPRRNTPALWNWGNDELVELSIILRVGDGPRMSRKASS